MRRIALATILLACTAGPQRAEADQVYLALGDSITRGETDLQYVPSYGDQGYVKLYADYLAGRQGGVRPDVVNLAIDGETAASFLSGSGRVAPVNGRGDIPLAAENLNYDPNTPGSQSAKLLATVAAEKAAGNTIGTVSITLGFNDLATSLTSGLPPAATLAAYRTTYGAVLDQIRGLLPDANLLMLGYYNPFPANPTSPAAPLFNTYGTQLNAIILGLAASHGATYVDTAPPFVGHEADLTYLAQMPAGSTVSGPYGGTLPIGNVHPNSSGYMAIAGRLEAVPEPSTAALLAGGAALGAGLARRRRRRSAS